MENQFIRYNDVLYKVDSLTGLKCYQKVKKILAEFDINLKDEISNEESSIDPNSSNPESKPKNSWESGLKVNKLV